MRYHNITHDDMLNGEGLRTVLWVSGCEHHCTNCHNPITWDINGGLFFDEDAERELFECLAPGYISGLTFSGGDPLHVNNRSEITRLAKKVKEKYPEKNIWLYTGYSWEQISNLEVVKYIDVIVDGKFMEELKDKSLKWKGSSNQRTIDVQGTLKKGEVVLYED
ncbi:MAG: anaerobic ribonucleoside-triphosphate reductase activating protein [Clostridia bacterium]|nr:anaerobic ribonucleoside-triphosphate reductase activating protein [Clostridia bacterium]